MLLRSIEYGTASNEPGELKDQTDDNERETEALGRPPVFN
jgi:hypothetical protein